MTKKYLYVALASLFLLAANSWGQDNQQENAEALKTASENTHPSAQDSETKKTPEVKASSTVENPPKNTKNTETTDVREPTHEKAIPAPTQGAETRMPAGVQNPDTEDNPLKDTKNTETTDVQEPTDEKATPAPSQGTETRMLAEVQSPDAEDKPTQENVNKTSGDTFNRILIIVLLGIVLTFIVYSVFLLKRVKTLKQENKEVLGILRQNQTKDPGGTGANTPTSENDIQLKAELNDKLEQIAKYMQIVSKSSTEAAVSSQETLAFAKQVSETVVAKEQELGMLRSGYQQSMIGPVINGFLNLRDNLNSLLSTDLEGGLKKQLENLNQSVKISLSEVGVNELLLEIGSNPLALESKKWRALEATRPTNEEQLDGAVAAIIKPGYTSVGPQGSEIVIRKAEVVRYKYNDQ